MKDERIAELESWAKTLEDNVRLMTERHPADLAALVAKDAEIARLQGKVGWGRRRLDRLQQEQRRMRDPERTIVCDILANGTLLPDPNGTRYGKEEAMTNEPTSGSAETGEARSDGLDGYRRLQEQIRETPLIDRLREIPSRIGKMCSERRPPAMSIPIRAQDDDIFISTTVTDAADHLAAERKRHEEEIADERSKVAQLETQYAEDTAKLAAKDAEIARLRLTEAENYGVLIEEMRHAWRPQPSSFVRFEEIEAFISSMGTHRVASSLRADYETALHETRIFWAAAIDEMKKQYADLLRNNERLVDERNRSEWAKGIVDSVARENTGLLQDAQAKLAAQAERIAELGQKLAALENYTSALLGRLTNGRISKPMGELATVEAAVDEAFTTELRAEIDAIQPLAEIGKLAVDLRRAEVDGHPWGVEPLYGAIEKLLRKERKNGPDYVVLRSRPGFVACRTRPGRRRTPCPYCAAEDGKKGEGKDE